MGALLLASALAFMPIAAVHSIAGAHPLEDDTLMPNTGNTFDANSTDDSERADKGSTDPSVLPSSFYLTNADLVTNVKLQNPWGACWAFAIASAVESSILEAQAREDGTINQRLQEARTDTPKLSGLPSDVDISERAIAWLAHELQTEETAGGQAGEGLFRVDEGNYATQLAGGNFSIVKAALAAQQSLVSEEAVPYQYNGYEPGKTPWYSTSNMGVDARSFDWSVDDSVRTENDLGWYVSGILDLPSPAVCQYNATAATYEYIGYDADATRQIKRALMNEGAVAISLEAETSLPGERRTSNHFDYETWSQYDARYSVSTNHAVTIVGWDDEYSKESFGGTTSGQPPANGAWLCKNNWASDELYGQLGGAADATHWGISDENGASGFFWLSYYDHTIMSPVAFQVAPIDQTHDKLYQYDYVGISEYFEPSSFEGTVRVANMFTAEKTELLKSVTAQTFHPDELVECWIYLLPDKGNMGQLAAEAKETFAYAGFHTMVLDSPVLVAEGQRFMVVQRVHANIESDGHSMDASYLSLELAFANALEDASLVETMATVVSNPGETYVALSDDDSQWMSLEHFNTWYQDVRAETGGADVTYGNALIKAHVDDTSMGNGEHVYQLVKL